MVSAIPVALEREFPGYIPMPVPKPFNPLKKVSEWGWVIGYDISIGWYIITGNKVVKINYWHLIDCMSEKELKSIVGVSEKIE